MDPEQPRRVQPEAGVIGVPASQRPGHVSAAGVILILLGVLVCLVGALVLLAGAIFPTLMDSPEFQVQIGDLPEAAGALFVVLGAILTGWGILEIVSGIFVLRGRGWARLTGIILAALGMLFALVGVLPGEGGMTAGGVAISVTVLAAYAYVAWALITSGAWFRS
jgi:hypothetical protein